MKIAIDARSLEGNKTGVGRYLENILRVWGEQKDNDFILYFKDGIPEKELLRSGNFICRRIRNPLGFSSNFFFQHLLLPYSLAKDKADFFFSPFYLRPLFCPVPSAIVLHDISYEAHPEWFDRKSQFVLKTLSRVSARKADIIFTVSEFSKKEIMKYYGVRSDKIVVTPLAPDSEFYVERDERKIGEVKGRYGLDKFVLCVGTIFTRRHVPEIVAAFERFSQRNPGYQLCFIGKNKTFPRVDIDGQIEEANGKLGAGRIVRLDFVSEEELMTLYSSCYAVIYLSDYEGFGLPVVEAQFFHKPIITSPNTSLLEVGEGAAEFVPANDISGIEQSLVRVLEDAQYCQTLQKKGGENLLRFDWRRCAEDTLAALLRKA